MVSDSINAPVYIPSGYEHGGVKQAYPFSIQYPCSVPQGYYYDPIVNWIRPLRQLPDVKINQTQKDGVTYYNFEVQNDFDRKQMLYVKYTYRKESTNKAQYVNGIFAGNNNLENKNNHYNYDVISVGCAVLIDVVHYKGLDDTILKKRLL